MKEESNNASDISKIKNDYLLKYILSYMEAAQILKMVQHNKKLQRRLGIGLENYKNMSELPKYKFVKRERKMEIKNKEYKEGKLKAKEEYLVLLISVLYFIYFMYFLSYATLLVVFDTFSEKNTKPNVNEDKKEKIFGLNIYLFYLFGLVIISWLLLSFYVLRNSAYDNKRKILKEVVVVLINLFNIVSEGILIWKLTLSYDILQGGIPWFMTMDYIFIFMHFGNIVFTIVLSYYYFANRGTRISVKETCILKSINDLEVRNFALPDNFDQLGKEKRKAYIIDNYYKFRFKTMTPPGENFTDIISKIRNLRKENNLSETQVEYDAYVPKFMVKAPSEMLFNPDKNYFKFSEREYLIKYREEELSNKIDRKDFETIQILMKDNLNVINYLNIHGKEYLLIFEEDKDLVNKRKGEEEVYDFEGDDFFKECYDEDTKHLALMVEE